MDKKPFVAIFLPAALAFSVSAFADEKVQWSDVPAAVQKTIADVKQPDGKKIEIKVGD
jgi:hypothetical protein